MFLPMFVTSGPPSLGEGVAGLLGGPVVLGTMIVMARVGLSGSFGCPGVVGVLQGLCLSNSMGDCHMPSCSTNLVERHPLL